MKALSTILCILLLWSCTTVVSQPCLPDGITFWSQSKIDSFQYNYPNCTEIEGYMRIRGYDVTNLNGLGGITSIGGELDIYLQPLLTSLNGLNAIASIGGDLKIEYCDAIVDLSGLEGLVSVDGNVNIGGDWQVGGNDLLQNISALSNLTSVGGFLQISGNDSLTSLNGLENLSHMGDALVIYGCNSLQNLLGWGDMDTLQGLGLGYNDNLINLEGLEAVSYINGTLFLSDNLQIANLEPLYSLTSVSGDIELWSNSSLSNLLGLNNLTSIGGGLKIIGNDRLTDMSAFLNLTSITGEIYISYADSLSTLHGLDNIDATSITDLTIAHNPLLSKCEVQSICNYLAAPNGIVTIYDNDEGCNSQQEVEESCTVNIAEQQSASKLSTYPNPFTTSTTIEYELTEPSHVQLAIYNAIGEQVYMAEDCLMPVGKHAFTWTPERLPDGMYYGVLSIEEGLSVQMLIKQR